MVFKILLLTLLPSYMFLFANAVSLSTNNIVNSLSPKEKSYINNKTINVSSEYGGLPFNFMIGSEVRGYTIDILNLISQKTGLKLNYINSLNKDEINRLFLENKLDILTHIIDLKRIEDLNFSRAFVNLDYYFFARNSLRNFISIDELNDVTIALEKGSYWEKIIARNYPNLNILLTSNIDESFQKILTNEADLTISDNLSFRYYKKKYKIKNIKSIKIDNSLRQIVSHGLHFSVKKGDEILLNILNKGIKSLSLFEIEEIDKKWFGIEDEKVTSITHNFNLNYLQEDYLAKKGNKLTICIDPDFISNDENENNYKLGFSSKVLDKISKLLDVKFEYKKTSDKQSAFESIKNRECDILPLSIPTQEKSKYLDFTDTYIKFPYVLATLQENLYVGSIEDVLDMDIAIVKDYPFTKVLKQRYPYKNFIEVNSVKEGLELLNEGSIFGFLDALMTIAYEVTHNDFNDVKISGTFNDNLEMSVATRNDEPLLNSILNNALKTLTEDDKKEVSNNWFNIENIDTIDYKLLVKVLFLLILLLIIGIIWNVSIHKQKEKTLRSLIEVKKLKNELFDKNKELTQQTIRDKLTSLYNRRKIDETLEYELKRFNRAKEKFCVVLIDIDFFKKVNNTFGHSVGDIVLKEFAETLSDSIRESDVLGRWSGEKFVIIAPSTSLVNATKFAEKMRIIIESHGFTKIVKLTASFGISEIKKGDNLEAIIERADKALYEAKRTGRNRIVALT